MNLFLDCLILLTSPFLAQRRIDDVFLDNAQYANKELIANNRFDVVSLNASWRLEEGDTVNLYNSGKGFDDSNYHYTHFTGWLVEEDLM